MATSHSDARRIEALDALLSRSITVASAVELLGREPWDSDVSLVIVLRSHVEAELRRFVTGEVTAQDVEDWAEVIEVRDDIDFQNETVKAIISELANPTLDGAPTPVSAQSMITRLAAS